MALSASPLFYRSPTFAFSLKHSVSPFLKLHISISTPSLSLSSTFSPPRPLSALSTKNLHFRLFSAVQEITVEEEKTEESQKENQADKRRKLYVANLPWDFSAPDIRNLLGECGSVEDVEIIKQKNGASRGFAFVTMGSGEEAKTAVEKFDSSEVKGRTIKVEFAKSMKKPSPPPPPGPATAETRHKIYVSNLAWKARSGNLKEFFAESFEPVSARVVFENPLGRSAGYGFVSFATKEEAEAAVSTLDGKELMGRSVRLKISEKNNNESQTEVQPDNSKGQLEEI